MLGKAGACQVTIEEKAAEPWVFEARFGGEGEGQTDRMGLGGAWVAAGSWLHTGCILGRSPRCRALVGDDRAGGQWVGQS